jgi:hypothetical protein
MSRPRSRRSILLAGAAVLGGLAAGCAGGSKPSPAPSSEATTPVSGTPPVTQLAAPETPTATPSPVPPRGRIERALLAGTALETPVTIVHSGEPGPVLMVLGGVHGNEPGGWLAAEETLGFEPAAGSLLVVPRANVEAISGFVRTTEALGDLNRLYPGSPASDLPMEQMAAEIVALAGDYHADVLLDLHESWAFYATRAQDGTAYLGQTVTGGIGPRNPGFAATLTERANQSITVERDLLIARDGSSFRSSSGGSRGRSSLSLGGHVPGLTPVLVEMGQEDQAVERRVELHLAVVRTALAELQML